MVVLITAAVCLLPFLTFVNMRMTGSLLHGEKVVSDPVSVTVQGVVWNYLFFPDKIDLEIEQSGAKNWVFIKPDEPETPLFPLLDVPYLIAGHGVYDKQDNSMAFCDYAIDLEDEMMLIYIYRDPQPVIVCSVEGEKTPEEIKEHFSAWLSIYAADD